MARDQRNSFQFESEKDDEAFESGVSREALIRSEMSGSVSILPDKKRGFGEEDYEKKRSKTLCIIMIIVLLVFLIGIILLIVGLVMLSTIPKCEKLSEKARYEAMCNPSSEAQENGFYKLLDKVQSFYYEMYPDHIAYKRPVSVKKIREKFKVYDPSPAFKKNMTDRSRALLKEVNALNMNALKLTQREAKALSQLKHSLKYMFGYMYDTNYYAGDYMLGPNLWCRQPICDVGRHLSQTLRYFKPNTIEDMELLRDRLKGVKRAFSQYIENLKYGVKAGMVRTIEECNAGINGLTSKYRIISFQGEQGVFKEEFLKDIVSVKFLANLTNNEQNKWQLKYAKPVNESLTEFILEFVGKPIASLFRYLRTEHPLHCVPNTVSSGLSFLPLSYVYVNGTADISQPTTKRLPTGEILNGTKTYEMLVGAFTTTDMTPDEIYELGIEMLYKLYPEALKLAKKVTGKNDNDTAIELFLQKINSSEMFYNKEKLPANESDKNAFKMCSTAEDAKKYCPKRWEAMQKMVGDILMFNSLIYPKIIKMFHFAGEKYTVPNCPLKIAPELNPSAGANYNIAGKDCLKSARYNVPFFKSRFGPKWSVLTVSAHEGRPGHHTQAQGKLERFGDTCGGTISWLGSLTFYTAFIEGWALYAESPLIAKETDIYEERPLQNFGVLKWQVWRALRLVVDSGLHSRRMSRQTAIEYFKNYTWDGGEMAEKEVTRYQSSFGQATSYMIGQQQIVKLRTYAQKELGSNFDLKDFHFYLLSQGSYPLNYAKEIVEQYVSCKKKDRPGCYDILNPPRAPDDSNFDQGVEGDMEYRYDPPQPRRETYYL